MLGILKDRLINILKEENVNSITLDNGNIINDFNLINESDTVTYVDNLTFTGFITKYADKNNLYLLENNYYYEFGFKSLNSLAIREYNVYPQIINFPISDALINLLGNFLDEYSELSSEDIKSYIRRSYEVYKIISDELNENYLVIYGMNEDNLI